MTKTAIELCEHTVNVDIAFLRHLLSKTIYGKKTKFRYTTLQTRVTFLVNLSDSDRKLLIETLNNIK